jgi:hypothetical protein
MPSLRAASLLLPPALSITARLVANHRALSWMRIGTTDLFSVL